ncbi:MbcA/ParS/Xre antitoxin family protein [Devosia lacusdianchii]|uniref:MbcA/ParS/Xre antitoxin family protein n=1 Tax=Devosia lacusdianchii TaxID=2917991 RepID=UPI001F05B5FE|nr:MbcA/ParS/Xre antitoxin family protein [Devosia sp. JXJ CY 41]
MAKVARMVRQTVAAGPDRLDASRFLPDNRRRLSGPGLRAFLAIADLWDLNEEQRRLVLGYPARSTFHHWTAKARMQESLTLDADVLTRISAVLGIHQALGVLFADPAEAMGWLRGPHAAPVFGGQPPLALVTSGSQDGLLTVRRFLDAARGGLYMPPNRIDLDFTPIDDSGIVWQ